MALRLATFTLLCAACSPDVASRIDDQAFPIQPNIPASPSPPAAPAPPLLTPCAPGWREVPAPEAGDAVTCDPWPAGGFQTCAADSVHFPGTPGCSLIGSACPAGDWPEGLPAGAPVLYVRPGAAGGTGSQASPFGSITAALAAATAGTILALAKGTFDEIVLVPKGITLWGACPAQTHLAPTTAGSTATLQVIGDGVVIRNLHLGGARPGVSINTPGAAVELRELLIGAQAVGVFAKNAVRVTGSRVVIRATQSRPGSNDQGQGLEVGAGAQVELQWVSLESNRTAGALVSGQGAVLELSDAAVLDTLGVLASGFFGDGLHAHTQGRIEGLRITVERNKAAGLMIQGGAQIVLTDAVVRETVLGNPLVDSGFGGLIILGGQLELRRAFVHRNRGAGLLLDNAGSALTFSDLVVRDTLGQPDRNGGTGLFARGGAVVKGARGALERNRRAGLSGEGAATVYELEDLTVRSTQPQTLDGKFGGGLNATSGARLTVTRALIEDSHCSGIFATNGSTLALLDITVRGTRVCKDTSLNGDGLAVDRGSTAVVGRILLERNQTAALFAADIGTTLTVTDAVARDTRVETGSGRHGHGVAAQYGANVLLSRIRVERNREAGLLAIGGARITGTDVVVRETRPSDCDVCKSTSLGVAAILDGSLVLSVFTISDNLQLGVELARNGTADLQAGEISNHAIGVNVQTKDFNLARIEREVVFRDNTTTVSAELLPLPDFRLPVR